MRKSITLLSLFLLLQFCAKVPLTGRKQVAFIPQSQLLAMSFTNYKSIMDSVNLVTSGPQYQMVRRVTLNLQEAVKQYFQQQGNSDVLEGYEWEFHLIEDTLVNAWAMPGGKIAVYTGLLDVAQNDAGLAVVIGHEIAHAIANHGNERMSQALLTQLGGVALGVAMRDKPEKTRQIFLSIYGAGANIGLMLPYSRLHESEADKLGLIFMAMAGYNPEEAIDFWQRMSKAGGPKPPEFLSSHPSSESRIAGIKEALPQAMKYYKN